MHLSVLFRHVQALGIEGEAENDIVCSGGDVAEAADAGRLIHAPVGIDVAEAVHLQCAHEAAVQAAPVVEIELHGHIADGIRTDHGAKFQSSRGQTAGAAGLHREGKILQYPFRRSVLADLFRDADADVYNVTALEFLRSTPSDDVGREIGTHLSAAGILLFQAVVPVLHMGGGDMDITRECAEGLIVSFRLAHDHHVYQHSRNDHIPRAAEIRLYPVHLHDDLAVISPRKLGNGQGVDGAVLAFEGDVSLGVDAGSFDKGNIEGGETVAKIVLPFDVYDLYERIVVGNAVEGRAFHARVGKDAEAELGDVTVVPARLRAHGVGHGTEGQIVCLKAVLQHQLLGAGHGAEMSADDFADRTLANIVLRAAVRIKEAEARGRDQRQLVRVSGPAEAVCDGVVQLLRICCADKGVEADHRAVGYEFYSVGCFHDREHCAFPISLFTAYYYRLFYSFFQVKIELEIVSARGLRTIAALMEICKCVGKSTDGVDQPLIHRLLSCEDTADIICKLGGIRHKAHEALLRDTGMTRDESSDARLHAGKVVIGLRGADHDAGDAHRMDHHGGRGCDEAPVSRDSKRPADGVSSAKHQRGRWLSHAGDHLRDG